MEDGEYQIDIPKDKVKVDFLFSRKVEKGMRSELFWECNLRVVTPEVVSKDEVSQLFKWCYDKSNLLSHVSIDFESENAPIFKLKIVGIRSDGRCEFCRSFRTALKTHFSDKFRVYNDRVCRLEGG